MPPPIFVPAENASVTAVNPLLIVAAEPEALFRPVTKIEPLKVGVSDPGCKLVLDVDDALPISDSYPLEQPAIASTPKTVKPPVTVNVWLALTVGLSQK